VGTTEPDSTLSEGARIGGMDQDGRPISNFNLEDLDRNQLGNKAKPQARTHLVWGLGANAVR
jgi:hypothetical protein